MSLKKGLDPNCHLSIPFRNAEGNDLQSYSSFTQDLHLQFHMTSLSNISCTYMEVAVRLTANLACFFKIVVQLLYTELHYMGADVGRLQPNNHCRKFLQIAIFVSSFFGKTPGFHTISEIQVGNDQLYFSLCLFF